MSKSAADGMEAVEVSNVASDKEFGRKRHTVDSRHCRNKKDAGGMTQAARKKESVRGDEPEVTDLPPDIDVAHAVSVGKSIAKDKDIGRATEAPVFLPFCSSQAADDIEFIGEGK